MSKSLGTGVDPLDLIAKYGADATRFGLMYQMSYDRQAIKFDEEVIKSARNFANKIWNLARLLKSLPEKSEATVADQWIEERAGEVIHKVTVFLNQYKLGEAARLLYEFIWSDFADWYVEILKREGSTDVARRVFRNILKLLHPFVPHVTEVLWPSFDKDVQGKSARMLIVSQWPAALRQKTKGDKLSKTMKRFRDIVSTVRGARILFTIPQREIIELYLDEETVLPQALAALCHVRLVRKSVLEMRHFPLATGGRVALGSASITPASVAAARERLHQEEAKLSTLITYQTKVLNQMRSKASTDAVAEKEMVFAEATKRLAEIQRSQEALQ